MVSPEPPYPLPRASRTSPSSSRWPTGPTASRRRSTLARRRSGTQFDPALVEIVDADAEKVFHELDELDSWDAVIDGEPALTRTALGRGVRRGPGRDRPVRRPEVAVHRWATRKRSRGWPRPRPPASVSRRRTSGSCTGPGWSPGFGRLGVSNAIWDKPGPLSAAEWERVRLYPHYTERMLHRSRALAPAGRLAGQVAERLDGSGYPGGLAGRPRSACPAGSSPPRRCSRPSARPGRTGLRSPSPEIDDGSCGTTSAPAAWTARSSTPCCAPPASGCTVVRPARPASPPGRSRSCSAWCAASRTGRSRRRW